MVGTKPVVGGSLARSLRAYSDPRRRRVLLSPCCADLSGTFETELGVSRELPENFLLQGGGGLGVALGWQTQALLANFSGHF